MTRTRSIGICVLPAVIRTFMLLYCSGLRNKNGTGANPFRWRRVCSCYLGGKFARAAGRVRGGRKSTPLRHPRSSAMPPRTVAAASVVTREERIEAIMKELRPKIDETVRQMVERAVDVPEAEEFGAIDFEFRDAGQKLVNEVRQASVASRKKRGT